VFRFLNPDILCDTLEGVYRIAAHVQYHSGAGIIRQGGASGSRTGRIHGSEACGIGNRPGETSRRERLKL
jgi:hypothetical protein